MKRTDKFLISHKPYAVDLSSLRTREDTKRDGSPYYSGRIDAVWFRRRRENRYGELRTVACIGTLWDYQDGKPTVDPVEFLKRHDDGRHGGDCIGRWDGKSYWGNVTLDMQRQHLHVLKPMLDSYPAIPDGYDGWWRF